MKPCGYCRGRGLRKSPVGLALLPCDKCAGTGIKPRPGAFRQPPAGNMARDPQDFAKVRLGTCTFCERPATEWHHVISRQRLKRMVPAQATLQVRALRDIRNLVAVCRLDHERIENGLIKPGIFETELHPEFWQFVHDYNLEGALPRHLSCGAAASDVRPEPGRSLSHRTERSPREDRSAA